jgi:hypothetical protein
MVPHIFQGLESLPRLPNNKVNKRALPKPEVAEDGAETVMELDSLGQMRKFTRHAASEDRVLDNVRAILIGVVIQSHSTPLMGQSAAMLDSAWRPLGASWGPIQLFLLQLSRGGGWTSLAFLNGFDDTRAMNPYGLTYREPLFLILWVLLDFNWTMWYLPVFAYMRGVFCLAHYLGVERVHLVLAAQVWLLLPGFVDLYAGWRFTGTMPPSGCDSGCFCPWVEWPWAQTASFYLAGWWTVKGEQQELQHSFLGHAMIFIPCYWIGFYFGKPLFKVLTKVADEPRPWMRVLVSLAVFVAYVVMYQFGAPLTEGFNDSCQAYWLDGAFLWSQVGKNMAYWSLNLLRSLTYVVFIAAAVPVHLQTLSKNCFAALILSAFTPCLLDFPTMVLEIRTTLPAAISPLVETVWVFAMPFLYEFVTGALFATFVISFVAAVRSLKARFA